MGVKMGHLGVRMRGFVSYTLSPHEQHPFRGAIVKGVPNMVRRFFDQVWKVAPRKYQPNHIHKFIEDYNNDGK